MSDVETIKYFEFDGTQEGFSLLVDRLELGTLWPFRIMFIDRDNQQTQLWTGRIKFVPSGLILQKGDMYPIRIKD